MRSIKNRNGSLKPLKVTKVVLFLVALLCCNRLYTICASCALKEKNTLIWVKSKMAVIRKAAILVLAKQIICRRAGSKHKNDSCAVHEIPLRVCVDIY